MTFVNLHWLFDKMLPQAAPIQQLWGLTPFFVCKQPALEKNPYDHASNISISLNRLGFARFTFQTLRAKQPNPEKPKIFPKLPI
jgi:hypothetical protein